MTRPPVIRSAQTGVAQPELEAGHAEQLADLYQVVLFNDDVNSTEHVVGALQAVFGHALEIAVKIMIEAHTRGRAIAQVEDREAATRHARQLHSLHLTATVEPV